MECTICCDTEELLSLKCKCMICGMCMLKSIDAKYFEVIDEIQCPGQCAQKHSIHDLMNIHGLNDLLLYKYIKTSQDMRICPRKECNYSGIIQVNCSQFECHCGYKYRVKNENWNVKSFVTNLLTVRECPKCNRNIYKNGGCNHMTCKCSYEFCWICGQQFQHGKMQCYSNITIKFTLLIYLLLNICYQLRLLQSFMTVLILGIKFLIFNGSLMFFYLGVNELYQISKLNFECNKYYSDGNETFKRIINQKWIMFLILMAQFCILFLLLTWIQESWIIYCHFLMSELSVVIVIVITLKIRK